MKSHDVESTPFPGNSEEWELWKRSARWKIAAASVFLAGPSLFVWGYIDPSTLDFATRQILGSSLTWVGYFTVNVITLKLSSLMYYRGYKDAQLAKSFKDSSSEPLELIHN
jgi:hypothetical protein